ncbi:hypothetical protein TVAG_070810 [Trichomonas vaginalis G3]|uniref:Uncharacterized protein n=1 Tax=Trichomonas vaginalis (strain ATCC PRA-98 / G3) TaxID=412133 RepID=A2D7Y4_TRIV3|nr:hypothetical protein TVAGG3_1045430 [Trichomonas vaginalis G3]EAY23417.1 hypothetical protein TVAG_070810 [Trichomonas vaginalis G3]KAI5493830.1 hypothetical protein TVAGG3_1045430 [Trichomonas vaginalis G3]|eukprot:XP_001584403.1 hypothetical protein [Trichomonas vaginalis G3]
MSIKIPPGAPVFKAVKTQDIKTMSERFVYMMNDRAGDDYYFNCIDQKRKGLAKQEQPIKVQSNKSQRYEGFADIDTPSLGVSRLKHSIESQPFNTISGIELDYSLPFESNELLINRFWAKLIQLEELNRSPERNMPSINAYVRFCVHLIELDETSAFDVEGKPEQHQNLVYFLNQETGQKSLIRFLDMLPNFQKRFFFTAFMVLKDINVDDNSQFAIDFYTRLIAFLKTCKPKWVVAFAREISRAGFANLAAKRFRLGCAALVFSRARKFLTEKGIDKAESKMLTHSIQVFGDVIEKDKAVLLAGEFDTAFMGVILHAILKVSGSNSKIIAVLRQNNA